MTNRRAGKTNRKIALPWRQGKSYKAFTSRWWRREDRRRIQKGED